MERDYPSYARKLKGVKRPQPYPRLVTKQQVKDMLRSQRAKNEKKYKDYTQVATGVDNSSVTQPLTAISVGTSVNERIGSVVNFTDFEFSYIWRIGDATNIVRLIIYQYLSPETPPYPVQQETTFGGTTAYQEVDKDLIKILWDSGPQFMTADFVPQLGKRIITIKSDLVKKARFEEVGNQSDATIYYWAWSDSGAVPYPSLEFYSRVHYTDD